ncbi:hypothetical protein V5799_013244 [Amblyomma americanum]|uniref:Uncharacterized protein n=1 Tax=Amblyomma americanum TaxID=6943 RepID=A0AAQ4E6F2_AMBAM
MGSSGASASLLAVSEWAYAGVNHSLAGNGGPECAQFLSGRRRLWETALAVLWTLVLAIASCRRLQKSRGVQHGCSNAAQLKDSILRCHNKHTTSKETVPPAPKVVREDRGGKRCLLVLLCLVFGMELGFKFSSRTVIYILNPCHVITMLQIIMLAAPPTSRVMTVLFRVHVHWINGPLLALLFPVLNTRLLPLEQEVYWVQHGLMLAVPCYLMRLGGVFSTEPLGDLSWALLSIALQYLYHFLILQALALVTQASCTRHSAHGCCVSPGCTSAALLCRSMSIPPRGCMLPKL